ncbi:glycosyl hydrolase family 18 protein [candidate division KSB1 bacterium]|nr:glycosyl hydrolase family 18 protein [candidate division KSB1 bacterium]
MKHHSLRIVLSWLFMSASLLFSQQKIESLFYYVDKEHSFASLKNHIKQISIIAPAVYNVDEDDVVWGGVDPRVLKLAKQHNVGVMPLIHNPGFDQEMLHQLLVNETARQRTIESLVDECKKYGYRGIQFDFENLNINDKDAFTQFYAETAKALHAAGFQLSAAVVHRPEKYPGPTKYFKWLYKNWRAGYDLKALAEIGDFISIMTYSQHTRRTPPGPSAGIPWVKKNIEYFLSEVPAEKLSLGIPVQSMHWYTEQDEQHVANARSWSAGLSHQEALALADRFQAKINWLDEQKVPFTFFENAGLFEYIFFENAQSFQHKLDLVRQNQLRGFSVWVIGNEDPEIWKILEKVEVH